MEDTKKVQTLVNVAGQTVERMRTDMAILLAVRVAFQAANPDVTGTPLEGNLALVNAAIDALDAALNSPPHQAVWDGMIAAIVPTHLNDALEV